tara:strand:+ start:165 stop:509 length:345 start_codon:yes stop_codon:yes gene_type:complete
MRIECFSRSEWLQIADIISAHCPSEPVIERLITEINDKTNLFKELEEFLVKNNINPVFFPHRDIIEGLKNGKGITKRLSCYSTTEGKGMVQFKKDYQKYILDKYVITEKQEVNK